MSIVFTFQCMYGLFGRLKGKGKIMKQKAFCGKYNRDDAACLKNALNFLVV